ncbi:MAG: response regulator [Candidatus Kapabacteria bacterium]|nr:response regulator [Candidatus Kapabacteria bacterium]
MDSSIDNNEKGNEYKILIVDDDIWFHKYFTKHLKSWGFEVISAYNPYEGISLAAKENPILIFLDYIMPEMNGDNVLKILKAVENTKDIPVVFISGNLSADVIGAAYKMGAKGFLTKPVSLKVIYQKIEECLGSEVFAKLKLEHNPSEEPNFKVFKL